MRAILLFAACTLGLFWAGCRGIARQEPVFDEGTGWIGVAVTGLRNTDGQVLVTLFSSAEGFPGDAGSAVQARRVEPTEDTVTVRFEEVPYGRCAVSVLHDENSNGKLDTGVLGIPTEGYGASNNPPPRFGPPRFGESAFELRQAARRLNIEVHYRR